MRHSSSEPIRSTSNAHLLLAYVADLELEVDRLRKQGQFVHQAVRGSLKRIQLLCKDSAKAADPGVAEIGATLAEVEQTAKQLAAVLRDLQEPPGYHPAHDQVIAIAVRPLIEQVFRWQQRLVDAPQVALRLDLASQHMEWFAARLRHILDNLIFNSLKYRDPHKAEAWVQVALRLSPHGYELRVSDNGIGLPPGERAEK